MLEGIRFKNNYPLLVEFNYDKEVMSGLLKSKTFKAFYAENEEGIRNLISNLKLLYSPERVKKIIEDVVLSLNTNVYKNVCSNLFMFIEEVGKLNGNLEPLKNRDLEYFERRYNNVEDEALDICFFYHNNHRWRINGQDMDYVYARINSIEVKRKLLEFVKDEKRMQFFLQYYNKLAYRLDKSHLEDILKDKYLDLLFNPELESVLGENKYFEMLFKYFKYDLRKEKLIAVLKANNIPLLKDLGVMKFERVNLIDEEEAGNDLFDIRRMRTEGYLYDMIGYLYSGNARLSKIYKGLNTILTQTELEEFNRPYKDTIELLNKLERDNLKKLDIDELRVIYDEARKQPIEERRKIIAIAKEINDASEEKFREAYANNFKSADNIISKAQLETVSDSRGNLYEIPVYELRDEEPFSLLITAMHEKGRILDPNMYGRPKHIETMLNPALFMQDPRNGSEMISTTLLSNMYTDTFVGGYAQLMYVFSDIEPQDIISICAHDGRFPPDIKDINELFRDNTKVTSPYQLPIDTRNNGDISDYNEIAIRRKRNNEKIRPTAILCFDEINDYTIRHALFFNVPIIILNTKTYRNIAGLVPEKNQNPYHRR